ncbi:MAG TPA: hypothetical protein VKQ36_08175 [Ktedonobacterales bacterium]|nr:hypothetical protein [Ktedonobacterales bacterium]
MAGRSQRAMQATTGRQKASLTATAVAVVGQAARRTKRTPNMLPGESEIAELRALAAEVEARRRQRGAPLRALADALSVSQATVSRTLSHARSVVAQPTLTSQRTRNHLRDRLTALAHALDSLGMLAEANTLRQARPSSPPSQERANQPKTMAALAARSRRELATYRILILENDADIIDIYRLALADAAYEPGLSAAHYEAEVVKSIEDCLAALEAAHGRQQPYDVLLMDLSLRDLRGIQTQQIATGAFASLEGSTQRLLDRLAHAGALLPRRCLVVSGMASYHLRQVGATLATLGAAYLAKPFAIDDLLAAVYSLCAPGAAPAACLAFFVADRQFLGRAT